MPNKDYESALKEFQSTHNQVSDLLTPVEYARYQILSYPDNVSILNTALKKKLALDPNYEVWVPIHYYKYLVLDTAKGVSTFYTKYAFISNKGNIHHIRKKTKAPQGHTTQSGHQSSLVRLIDGPVRFSLHRAVACSFVPLPEKFKHVGHGYAQVKHRDTDKAHNDFINLEWDSNVVEQEKDLPSAVIQSAIHHDHYGIRPLMGEVIIPGEHLGVRFIRSGDREITDLLGTSGLVDIDEVLRNKVKEANGIRWTPATDSDVIVYGTSVIPTSLVRMLRNYRDTRSNREAGAIRV